MGNYVIGLGGTGAKCLESFAYLSAAGLGSGAPAWYAFVDADTSNGNLERAQAALDIQRQVRDIGLGRCELLKSQLIYEPSNFWSPFARRNETLEEFFSYTSFKRERPELGALFEALFAQDERSENLAEGFLGHTSIGAAAMASAFDLTHSEPWETMFSRASVELESQPVRILLFGSIFGGTGASGLPTLARLLRDGFGTERKNLSIGAVLVLPYFTFRPKNDGSLEADPKSFVLGSQAALEYYRDLEDLAIFDSIYLMGESKPAVMRVSEKGGPKQKNDHHVTEVYAALAGIDFLSLPDPGGRHIVGRSKSDLIGWSDLPYSGGGDLVRVKIDALARFSFAYLSSYLPAIRQIATAGQSFRAPWYVDFFERRGLVIHATAEGMLDPQDATSSSLEAVATFCKNALAWLANIQTSAASDELVLELINWRAFATRPNPDAEIELRDFSSFLLDEFTQLTLPGGEPRPKALSNVWARMSSIRDRDVEAGALGGFLASLYRECAKA